MIKRRIRFRLLSTVLVVSITAFLAVKIWMQRFDHSWDQLSRPVSLETQGGKSLETVADSSSQNLTRLEFGSNWTEIKAEKTLSEPKIAAKPVIKAIDTNEKVNGKSWSYVCIVGTTPNITTALNVHRQWGDVIPSFWYILNYPSKHQSIEEKLTDLNPPSNLYMRSAPKGKPIKTVANAIHSMLKLSREKHHCEYVFTYQQDAKNIPTIHLDSSFSAKSSSSLKETLFNTLSKHQPAVVGFPWTEADDAIPAMKSLKKKYEGQEVSPLTGFHPQLALYHQSVVDFFIPYSPSEAFDVTGKELIQNIHFQNLFASLIFKGAAIRCNQFMIKNSFIEEDARILKIWDGSSLIEYNSFMSHHHNTRDLNEPYIKKLLDGMIQLNAPWGMYLGEKDVDYNVETIDSSLVYTDIQKNKGLQRSFDKWTVLDLINNVYELTYPTISKNEYFKLNFKTEELLNYRTEFAASKNFEIIIHVFTMNRNVSFNRLWNSINNANPIKHAVQVQIHVDRPQDLELAEFTEEYINFLETLKCTHGSVVVLANKENKGLRDSIMGGWTPKHKREYGIFLEDDISVSPHFLEYAEQMIQQYLHQRTATGSSPKVIGVSLYHYKFEEVNFKDWSIDTSDNFNPYIMQHPQSWGAVYSPASWAEFQRWFYTMPNITELKIPRSRTNRWAPTKGWKRFLVQFMFNRGLFMVYPNFPSGFALSTNHVEFGTNAKKTGAELQLMRERFEVPLLDLKQFWSEQNAKGDDESAGSRFYKSISVKNGDRIFLNLTAGRGSKEDIPLEKSTDSKPAKKTPKQKPFIPGLDPNALIPKSHYLLPLDELRVVNAHYNISESYNDLKHGTGEKTVYEKCTMIMMVYSRTDTILDRLNFYHTFPYFDSIVIVWSNPNVEPPEIRHPLKNGKKSLPYFKIPVHFLKQKTNSLNDRFQDFPEIKTRCVMPMDDDYDMPHKNLMYSIHLFTHFPDRISGFHQLGRMHKWNAERNGWDYSFDDTAVSIVLPSGSTFHRKYLAMYNEDRFKKGRDIAHKLMNCEDIFFNLMVANETGLSPIVVEGMNSSPINMGGLHHRPKHILERSLCLDKFVNEVFDGKMPLKYATSFV